jgi:hypothetical protein
MIDIMGIALKKESNIFDFEFTSNTKKCIIAFTDMPLEPVLLDDVEHSSNVYYFGYEFLRADATKLQRCAIGLILGGAVGNGLDRVIRGHVIDFLDFWFGSWEYWIFNLADSFIVCGVILYATTIFLEFMKSKKANKAGQAAEN